MAITLLKKIEDLKIFLSKNERIEVEIGSGNGHFLAAYAASQPNLGLVGNELKHKRCLKIQKKLTKLDLKNVFLFEGDASLLLTNLNENSIDAFHIYFPDPWPKAGHLKRRLLKLAIIKRLAQLLKPAGKIYFASDVFDYYLQVKILAIHASNFSLLENNLPLQISFSLYAQKTKAKGLKLYALTLLKK